MITLSSHCWVLPSPGLSMETTQLVKPMPLSRSIFHFCFIVRGGRCVKTLLRAFGDELKAKGIESGKMVGGAPDPIQFFLLIPLTPKLGWRLKENLTSRWSGAKKVHCCSSDLVWEDPKTLHLHVNFQGSYRLAGGIPLSWSSSSLELTRTC